MHQYISLNALKFNKLMWRSHAPHLRYTGHRRLAVRASLWQSGFMAERIAPTRKTPTEILDDLIRGHGEALYGGAEKGKKYLLTIVERHNSIPNAVKFFLYDLLSEDAFQSGDLETCRSAVDRATEYLPVAQAEMLQSFRTYCPSVRYFERGIALAIDEGEFDRALSLCDGATAIGLGKAYSAKRASIERMM